MTRLISFDFDGVFNTYRDARDWEGAEVCTLSPVPEAIELLKQLLEDPDFDVCIFSSRNEQQDGIACMYDWLEKHGVSRNHLNRINFPLSKPSAYMFIDDRAWGWRGELPTIEEIRKFETERWEEDERFQRLCWLVEELLVVESKMDDTVRPFDRAKLLAERREVLTNLSDAVDWEGDE